MAQLGGSDAGGMNLYVRRLTAELSNRGWDVDVFTRRTERSLPEIAPLEGGGRLVLLAAGPPRQLVRNELPVHLPALVSAFGGFLEREQRGYDVLHSHYWLSGLAGMRYHALVGERVPHVHMFHTLSRLKERYGGDLKAKDSSLRSDGERCLIGRADVIVGATEGEREDMVALYGKSPRRYEIIPPGVDLDLFYPRDPGLSRSFLNLRARHVILFVGRQDRLKGLETLLQAVRLMPEQVIENLEVVIVGGYAESNGHGAGAEHQLATDLGLAHRVRFRGKVPQAELPFYYSAASVCAMPSAYESFGMVAIESMACQTPVVAFRVGGLATTISDGRTGILAAAGDASEYAQRLQEALTRADLRSMGRRARMSVQRYTWERTADRSSALYEDLLAEYAVGADSQSIAR
jgi:D-inositol-3-phosphate glycosyltransferase